jgi:transcriptional regulatory protein LevR
MIFPSSTEFCWQDAWMDEDVENFYGSYIITSIFKTKFVREGQLIIVQIGKLKRIGENFKEKLKDLADVLVNGYG